jgi:lipoprotein-anchoring transpeptidase ErfK/SrfK
MRYLSRRFEALDYPLIATLLAGTMLVTVSGAAFGQQLSLADTRAPVTAIDHALRDQPAMDAPDPALQVPERLRRQVVEYSGREAPGTIIVDTPNTYLFLVMPDGKAMRYGIGVGRSGFTWAGTQTVARKSEWPDWYPPSEMIARQPYLPRFVAGGPTNPLGARAMYLGNTEYRIHGTNQPETIGHNVSSGCIRLNNDDVIDLYSRVNIGAKVVVLPMTAKAQMASQTRAASAAPALSVSSRVASMRPASVTMPVADVSYTYTSQSSFKAHGLY